jgi:hypothetical protein
VGSGFGLLWLIHRSELFSHSPARKSYLP